MRTDEPTRVLAELTSAAVARGEELEGLQVRRPSLEEVYLALTAERGRGRGMSAEAIRIAGRRPVRRLFVHQLRSEQLVFWRSREAAFFIFLFPLLLFVLLGSVYSGKFEGLPVGLERSSPGSSATGARTPPSPALRSSSSCDARAGSSSGSARRLCRPRPTSPRSSPRRWSCSRSRRSRSSCSDARSTGRPFPPTSARSSSPS